MTIKEIENELENIYKERKTWSGTKGPVTKLAIRLKELILIKQQILYRIEDAKLLKDRREESFNTILYRIIDNYMIILRSKGIKYKQGKIRFSRGNVTDSPIIRN